MKHNIPEWYIPDGEQVLANDHEREQFEEEGELEEPLCPHCGNTYISKSGDIYTHALTKVHSDLPSEGSTLKPGLMCVSGEQRRANGYGEDNGFSGL